MKRGPGLRALCREHRNPLEVSFDTDGDGGTLLYVRPCPDCRSRIVPRGARTAAEARSNGGPLGNALVVTAAPAAKRVAPRAPLGNRYRTKKNDAGEYVCIICDTPLDFVQNGKVGGRIPVFCATHRDPSNRPAIWSPS